MGEDSDNYICRTINIYRMKNKLSALCIVLAATAFGQLMAQTATDEVVTDSSAVESVKYQQMNRLGLLDDTRSDLIKKCLNHLAESIADDDKEKVYNLKEYALTLEDSVYLPLPPRELWLIDLYLNRFDDFLNDVVALDSARDAELGPKIIFNSNLYYVVHGKVSDNLEAIKQTAHADASLTETDKDFIDVFLRQLETTPNNHIDIMNRESGQFLKNHPDSRYDYYVKQNLTYKFVKDPDGFQFEVAVGAGMSVLASGITDWFNTVPATFDCDITYAINRYEVSFHFVVSPCELKQSFRFDDGEVWMPKFDGNIGNYQLFVGRYFPLKHNFMFIPRVGLGLTEILPICDRDNKDNSLKDERLRSILPALGAEIRYEKMFFDGNMPCFWGPALRLTVQPIRTKIEGEAVSGAMTTLSLVVKFGFCDAKRVY